jgi:hypothetical protein
MRYRALALPLLHARNFELGKTLPVFFPDELSLSDKAWSSLPSTKMKRPRQSDPFAWCYTYTGFSLAFAHAALQQLGAQTGSTILDPFVGSGTTLIAAGLRDCSALGIDISPFSVLLSRARLATAANPERVLNYLSTKQNPKQKTNKLNQPGSLQVLLPHHEAYAAGVVSKVCDNFQMAPHDFWLALLADDTGRYDSEAVVLLSLSLGARDCARLIRGSNPIWYRKMSDDENLEIGDLRSAAMGWGMSVSHDLMNSSPTARKGTRVVNADFSSARLKGSFDFCLTSPPYLNRLDYVVAHLPELSILKYVAPIDIERLRSAMIGTTKIVTKEEGATPEQWGPSCRATLERIWDHKAYASRRYYYYTYRQYFARLYSSLERLTRMLRRRAQGIVVIQNSFYKDLNIPTPNIASEMLQSLASRSQIVRTEYVKAHMGRMSPKQTTYAPHKTLAESVIHFSK